MAAMARADCPKCGKALHVPTPRNVSTGQCSGCGARLTFQPTRATPQDRDDRLPSQPAEATPASHGRYGLSHYAIAFLLIGTLAYLGSILGGRERDPSLEALLQTPNAATVGRALGYMMLVGAFPLAGAVLGLIAWRRDHSRAAATVFCLGAGLLVAFCIAEFTSPPSGAGHLHARAQPTQTTPSTQPPEQPSRTARAFDLEVTPASVSTPARYQSDDVGQLPDERAAGTSSLVHDYTSELEQMGWADPYHLVSPAWLERVQTLAESRASMEGTRAVIEKYRGKAHELAAGLRANTDPTDVAEGLDPTAPANVDTEPEPAKRDLDAMFEIHAQIVSEWDKILDMFATDDAGWSPSGDEIVFASDEGAEKFNTSLASIGKLAGRLDSVRVHQTSGATRHLEGKSEGPEELD